VCAPTSGAVPVLPCVVRCGAEAIAPGHIVHHGFASFKVPGSPVAVALGAVFETTALELVAVDDFPTVAWEKLISNVTCSPLTALTRPAARDLARRRHRRARNPVGHRMPTCGRGGRRTPRPGNGAADGRIDARGQSPDGLVDALRPARLEADRVRGADRSGRALRPSVLGADPMNDAIYALLSVASAGWASAE